MKTQKNTCKVFILLLTILILAFSFSCDGLLTAKTGNQGNTAYGTLKVNLADFSATRNAINPADIVEFFKISVISENGDVVIPPEKVTGNTYTKEIPVGTYSVIVQAMNSGNKIPEDTDPADLEEMKEELKIFYKTNTPIYIGRTNDIAVESDKTTDVSVEMIMFPYLTEIADGYVTLKDSTFDWGCGKLPEIVVRDMKFIGWYEDDTFRKAVSDFPDTTGFNGKSAFPYPLIKEPITISFWHIDTSDEQQAAWRQIAGNFEKSHPGVTVDIRPIDNESFKQEIAIRSYNNDHLPDIFKSWGGGVMIDMVKRGQLRDITEYTKSGAISQLSEDARGVYSYNGKQYGAPYSLGVVGLFYNKTVFEDAGLTEDDFSTWDKFLASCNTLKTKGYAPVALGESETWTGQYWYTYLTQRLGGERDFLNAYNGTDGGAFNTGSFLTAMEMFGDFVATEPFQEGFLDATQVDQDALVADRVAAMTLMGQWAPSSGRDNATQGYNDEWGLMQFPTIDGGKGLLTDVQGGGDGYIISATAPDEAIEFLKSLYEPENYRIICTQLYTCPVIPGYDDCVEPIMAEVSDAVQNAGYYQLYWDQFLPTVVGEKLKEACEGIYRGTLTPQEACNLIQTSWEANR